MTKERLVQILTHKINELEKKITNYKKFGISEKKIEKLELMKLKYEDELVEIE